MSDRVIAISSEVVECGKRVSDSKKRFVWRFRIGDTTYDLQLVSSALSGKRAITLNDKPIYSEQNVLNINFDFNHNIEGHSLRLFRESEGVHNYDLRIDNRSFEYLLKKKDNPVTETKVTGKYEAASYDPFSEFEKVASNSASINQKSNFGDFGDFGDFSNLETTKPEKKLSNLQKKTQQAKQSGFDFEFGKKEISLNVENFETSNLSSLEKNMHNLDIASYDNFTTNNYGNYNNYLDLINGQQGKSDTWGIQTQPKEQSIFEKLKPDITGKQIINKTMMTAVEIKKKAVKQFESLI